MKVPMGPPPPKNPNPNPNPNPDPEPAPATGTADETLEKEEAQIDTEKVAPAEDSTLNPNPNAKPYSTSLRSKHSGITIPYSTPSWSEPPGQPFFFEVLKDGAIVEQLDVYGSFFN